MSGDRSPQRRRFRPSAPATRLATSLPRAAGRRGAEGLLFELALAVFVAAVVAAIALIPPGWWM